MTFDLKRMPELPPVHHDLPVLDVYWRGWEKWVMSRSSDPAELTLPPLEDWAVQAAVEDFGAPAWIMRKDETIRMAGGEASRDPSDFPDEELLVIKPAWNPEGLAEGARVEERDKARLAADEICQPAYDGPHISLDIAMRDGRVQWTIRSHGIPGNFGRFSQWEVDSYAGERLFDKSVLQKRLEETLPRFSGMLNVEMVAGHPIEMHFRPSLEFFPLYGDAAVEAIMQAAIGKAPRNLPPVTGGFADIVSREGSGSVRVVDVEETGEDSWRRAIVYRGP